MVYKQSSSRLMEWTNKSNQYNLLRSQNNELSRVNGKLEWNVPGISNPNWSVKVKLRHSLRHTARIDWIKT